MADQYNLVQTMREVHLNKITWKLAVKGVRSVDAQLIWVEPFIWALLKLRWTPAPPPDAASVSIRERTCSWLELGLIIHSLSGGNAMPHDVTFAMCAAVTRNLWIALSKFFRAHGAADLPKLLKKVFIELPKAGAAVTCGIPNLKGVSRRPITDDFPKLATSIAALVKFAAATVDKMDAQIPLLKVVAECWQPSGLLETVLQMRNLVQVDYHPRRPRKRKRQGPCVFGCQPKATLSQNGSIQWYAVPEPSPWPGITPGETLCKRCYTLSRTSVGKRHRDESHFSILRPGHHTMVGRVVILQNLTSHPELNGRLASVVVPANDDDRVTVQIESSAVVICVASENAVLHTGAQS